MNRSLTLLTLASLGLLAAAGCAETAGTVDETRATARAVDPDDDGPPRRGHHGDHADLDTDGDGTISDAERAAAHAARVDELFARLDADGDGRLTAAELAVGPRRGPPLAELDTDGDGALSKAELLAAPPPGKHGRGRPHDHAAVDTDGDGAISDAERAAAHAARAAERFARLDVDGDGRVTATELAAAPGHGRRRAPALTELDTDGDGAISLDEFTAARPPGPPPR